MLDLPEQSACCLRTPGIIEGPAAGQGRESLRVDAVKTQGDRQVDSICSSRTQPDKAAKSDSWDSCLLLIGVFSYLHGENLSRKKLQRSQDGAQAGAHRSPLPSCWGFALGKEPQTELGLPRGCPALGQMGWQTGAGCRISFGPVWISARSIVTIDL